MSDQGQEQPRPSGAQRVVVGFDGSSSAKRAIEWAVRQAELTGMALEVVTTWEWPTSYGWAVPFPPDWDPRFEAAKLLEEAVDELRKAHPECTIRTSVVQGHPAPVLIDSSKGAKLLVVGSRGHGEFAGMLLGSVSEHCVTHAHCPVVVVRDED
jgi:nucleotide-binding universal stress UspA family protein